MAKTVDLESSGTFDIKVAKGTSFTLTFTYPTGTDLSGEWQMGIFSDGSNDYKVLKLLIPNSDIDVTGNVMTITVTTAQNTLEAGTYNFGIRKDIGDYSKAEYKGKLTVTSFFSKVV